MQTNNNYPNINPANNGTLEGFFDTAIFSTLKATDGVLPAKVLSYNRENNTAQVQIMINKVATSGEITSGIQLPSVPVLSIGGGNFVVNFPLQAGDLGFVLAMDRDISAFIQSLQAASPQVYTIKNFVSSVFMPCVIRGYAIGGEDAESMVIQSLDGSVKIALSGNDISIDAPTINVSSPSININSSTKVDIVTPLLYVDGNIEASGTITGNVPP